TESRGPRFGSPGSDFTCPISVPRLVRNTTMSLVFNGMSRGTRKYSSVRRVEYRASTKGISRMINHHDTMFNGGDAVHRSQMAGGRFSGSAVAPVSVGPPFCGASLGPPAAGGVGRMG